MNSRTKIGLGIVTYNDKEAYDNIKKSIPYDEVDQVYVYDLTDSKKYVRHTKKIKPLNDRPKDGTLPYAKNRLIERMIEDGIEHIFIMEDSVRFTNEASGVFNEYIETANEFGIKGALSFSWLHENVTKQGIPIVKNFIPSHSRDRGLVFTHHKNTVFEYFNKSIIEDLGYFDVEFKEGWHSFDYYMKLSKENRTSLWWWFPDIKNSFKYIEANESKSVYNPIGCASRVTPTDLEEGASLFEAKWKSKPFDLPHPDERALLDRIAHLISNYGIHSSGNNVNPAT